MPKSYQIEVSGSQGDTAYQIKVAILDDSNKELGTINHSLDENAVKGNVALVSHPGEGENTNLFADDQAQHDAERHRFQ